MSVEFFREHIARAAKDHRCSECAGTIRQGEMHCYQAQKFDGDFFADRLCVTCHEMWRAAWAAFGWVDTDDAPPLGGLRGYLRDEEGVACPDQWIKDVLAQKAEYAAARAAGQSDAQASGRLL